MLDLTALAALAGEHGDALGLPVAEVRIGGATHDLDAEPLVMGVVNLSRDSTYRDSVAVSTQSAIRRAQVMHAQGAGLIDIGAESSTLRAARVADDDQSAAMVPVIRALAERGVTTSVEAYSPAVLEACLQAGASVVNLTGSSDLSRIYELAASHEAAVVLCFVPGANVREVGDIPMGCDPIPVLLDYFAARIDQARAHGVTEVIIDPGLGFYYGNLTVPAVRVRHQAQVLLNSFRLRALGVPICQALPHAFDLFEEEFRTAESFFAVLAALGRVNIYRTHEVARVRATLHAMRALG
ncbi:MAG: dihydropteroate synthase [Candidatus Nanopelagicales bacterium]